MLSNACTYGLRAMVYLAVYRAQGYTPVRQIGEALGIPAPFLSKIFQQLTRAGLVTAHRGPNGGVRCTGDPETVTLLQIVVAIDGSGLFTDCVLGLPGCGTERPCPVHDEWAVKRRALRAMFEGRTLADAATSVHDDARRITSIGSDAERNGRATDRTTPVEPDP